MFLEPWDSSDLISMASYIHYVAPPYSARISAIYLLPFGKVWLGSICRV